MTTPRSLRLSLELDFEGERVTGWLADELGNDWAVSSWLDLLTVIDRALGGSADGAKRSNGSRRRGIETTVEPEANDSKGEGVVKT
jgi:hypothetical protein